MSCGCHNTCGGCGGGLRGLGGLPAGSAVKVGFELQKPGVLRTSGDPLDWGPAIEGCVYRSGAFTDVRVAYDARGWFHDYVTVVMETYEDLGNIEDAGDYAETAIRDCFPDLVITRRDATVGVGATDSQGNALPQGGTPGSPTTPGSQGCPQGTAPVWHWWGLKTTCDPIQAPANDECEHKSGMDWMACELGIGPSSGAVVGVVVALVAVIAISKIAK